MASRTEEKNSFKRLFGAKPTVEVDGGEIDAKDPTDAKSRVKVKDWIIDKFTNKKSRPKAIAAVAIALVAFIGIGHFVTSGFVENNRMNNLIGQTVTYASQTATDVQGDLGNVIKKAQDAQTAANEAMYAATHIESLEDAVKAYRLASDAKSSEIATLVSVRDDNREPAMNQAFAASNDASAAIEKVQGALNKINEIPEDRQTEELKAKKLELEQYLVDHSQELQVLPLLEDEDASFSISLKDARNIADQAYEIAQNAATIAFDKVLELADENTIPNEVTFDISTDAELAKLVRGANAGKVTEFISGQYAGNILALYFRGNDGWGNDAVYEIKVDTENATYKFAKDNSEAYAAEIKSLIKEQKPGSALYANILDRGNYISIDSEVKKTSTMISYSILSKDANGNFVASEKVTLQEKGQLSEEDVIAKVLKTVENANTTFALVVDGEEIDL